VTLLDRKQFPPRDNKLVPSAQVVVDASEEHAAFQEGSNIFVQNDGMHLSHHDMNLNDDDNTPT
jgi:hypothetical protein